MAKPKKIEELNCEMNAADAIPLVVIGRFTEMAQYRDDAVAERNVDGVHDMRVASRRLRSALKDFEPWLRARPLKSVLAKIKDIADALGAVRDQDVLRQNLEKKSESCPEPVSAGLILMIAEITDGRDQSREALVRLLGNGSLDRIAADLEKAIGKALKQKHNSGGKPARVRRHTYRELGHEVVSQRIEELLLIAPSIFEPFRRKRLHRMRISGKHLRYALQLFSDCMPESCDEITEHVTKLQGHLGNLHDADVFIEDLGSKLAFSASVGSSGDGWKLESAAQVWLLNEYTKMRTDYYSQALEEWGELELRLLKMTLPGDLTRAEPKEQ